MRLVNQNKYGGFLCGPLSGPLVVNLGDRFYISVFSNITLTLFCSSGIRPAKSDSEQSHLAITVEHMVSLWCMMSQIRSPSTMSDSGCRRSTAMPVRMSTSCSSATNVISQLRK